ncbi:right-handed parallel beta-helix repeat-containing protein [Paraflavitalea sp. CAU 1676]|uniref:right-handed parallel beta-helix repeat-containing protein n=1 Tax=Paraflavitalea sp. CAU 1676 TaxID=3032598 RepID=UPI0023DBF714|nr:right-handed parallel beta-helix repeat-containing protein [Paraflavitalea sp. CAU 1676]MDF2188190.1 right-handed parallel beta-helix repeat-containing protein [Paraflavitalea sp. CAU 1676]
MQFILRVSILAIVCTLTLLCPVSMRGQAFIHPGIDQTAKDLLHMKQQALKSSGRWKDAFDRLKAATDTAFTPAAHAYVLRGPYGKPNIGGNELSRSASMAYNYALIWYITGEKNYAHKAIAILDSWSPALWQFDYNDAKLLAAWTGHQLCNAAELLRYTGAGWKTESIDQFKEMLTTVYYPLLRYYYPQANGNWDGAIIHSLVAMGIFLDNRAMFNNAIDHFLHAPVNGSLFKYIYASGQCQETMRDQGHVQLGLGEFAGAAQVAFTQGVDLFSNLRLALGYEYTAKFLLGEKPHSYGPISERAKELRDDYEYVYWHYKARNINLPFTERAADSVRPRASRSVLTAVRAPLGIPVTKGKTPVAGVWASVRGATIADVFPEDAVFVAPGQSLQQALDGAAGTRRWVVAQAGVHTLPAPLRIPGGVRLSGVGLATVLFLDPASGARETIVNGSDNMSNVVIRDLVIEGSNTTSIPSDPNSSRSYRGGYNRGGILFRAPKEGMMQDVALVNLTVRNCTFNGVLISGATGVEVSGCDLSENGVSVPPGQKLLHNLQLLHCQDARVTKCRLVTSPLGSGIAIDQSTKVIIDSCEIARNGYYGVLIAESKHVSVLNSLIEANDRSGVMVEFLYRGSTNITATGNKIQFNAGYGIAAYGAGNTRFEKNTLLSNGNSTDQQKISAARSIQME